MNAYISSVRKQEDGGANALVRIVFSPEEVELIQQGKLCKEDIEEKAIAVVEERL